MQQRYCLIKRDHQFRNTLLSSFFASLPFALAFKLRCNWFKIFNIVRQPLRKVLWLVAGAHCCV